MPTPSVPLTNIGSLYPARAKSKTPPNPPISASEPGRLVVRMRGLIARTRSFPASIETPASAYVNDCFEAVEVARALVVRDKKSDGWVVLKSQRIKNL